MSLRKVNLSGHCHAIDSLLMHLCKNCEFLEEVTIMNCSSITCIGIASANRERPTLKSISITWRSIKPRYNNINSHFIDLLVSLKGLTCLDLSSSCIPDELLSSIAIGGLPLRRLVLHNCTGYSYAEIFSLLSKCQCIQHLDLQKLTF
ncbi:putative leucine-rich repeat domain, L domain-containing protein [Medicago truncatula]|uniref:Putative leucine-rich repeat domain, L domain-containing protein n=1 Tax=Medicago truncatula TaxID=3880 RepID=A0A396HZ70_MEDTR|nr:putative leucine-rich repeat domain, L domain-containing protein [Medicago truncatula]